MNGQTTGNGDQSDCNRNSVELEAVRKDLVSGTASETAPSKGRNGSAAVELSSVAPTRRRSSCANGKWNLLQGWMAEKKADSLQKNSEVEEAPPTASKSRFWMMFLFFALAVLVGIMYPEYSSMSGLTSCYYGVSQGAVAWTNSLPNALYVVLVVPATSAMEKLGLRRTFVVSSLLNTIAAALQFWTLSSNSFWMVMTSISFSSVASIGVLGTPAALASRWFPSREVSRACAVGVAGYQFGMCAGSLFPLVVSSDCDDHAAIQEGKMNVAIYLTAANAVILLLVFFTFKEHPPGQEKVAERSDYAVRDILGALGNRDFLLLLLLCGCFVGVYCAVLTTLNNIILRFFPSSEIDVGYMGSLYTLTGVVGGFLIGYLLDVTHKYKEICIGTCILSVALYVIFSGCLYVSSIWIQYITLGLSGLVIGGQLPLGYEYAIEVTYPLSEMMTANIITASGLLFAVILTQLATYVLDIYDMMICTIVLLTPLVLAGIVSVFITSEYKRTKSESEEILKDVKIYSVRL